MKAPQGRPLTRQLTRRMLFVQLVTLAAFFALILVPVFVVPLLVGVRNVHPPDPRVVEAVGSSIAYGSDRVLRLDLQPKLRELAEDYPDLWFVAVDSDGQELTFGELPPEAAYVRPALRDIISLQVLLETEDGSPGLLVRTIDKPGGSIKVALGGGPTLGLAAIIQVVTAMLMVATLLVLAVVSGATIPRLIRNELRGLSAAAATAESFNVDQRGLRIPEANLPAEVLALVHAVNRALERLDEAHSRRERFLADAAHELRTPIAVLSARIETAEPFPEREKLLSDVQRLADLANQLLDVQRLNLGKVAFERIDLVELASGLVGDMAPLAIARGYALELEAEAGSVWVEGDLSSLGRAIANVIRNAIAHGGGKGNIVVAVTPPGTISVSDDGPGIPDSETTRIFEPFHRVRPSAEGAGLGLSLVASIVASHGGRIEAGRSRTGGARFTITLQAA